MPEMPARLVHGVPGQPDLESLDLGQPLARVLDQIGVGPEVGNFGGNGGQGRAKCAGMLSSGR